MKRIGFIGAGNMAEAIIKGLSNKGGYKEIRAVNRTNRERIQRLQETYGLIPADLAETAQNSDVLVLAVKPKDMNQMLQQLKPLLSAKPLLVSVAAGISLEMLQGWLPGLPIVRAMPNTSSAVLASLTGLCAGNGVSEEQREDVEDIFKAVGKTLWIAESRMNSLIGISGSGPAYVYLFTEALAKAGETMGFSPEEALFLAKETLIGAAAMLEGTGKSPAQLRKEITSPNGTTLAALEEFGRLGIEGIVEVAAKAASKRAEEMEREYRT